MEYPQMYLNQTFILNQHSKKMSKVNIKDVRPGDVFSEEAHYRYVGKKGKEHEFVHLGTNQPVSLTEGYVQDLLVTADQFDKEVEVGKEDKLWTPKQIGEAKKKGELPSDTTVREGDVRVPGIRSIWSEIYSSKVFTVNFNKQSKELSAKALSDAKTKQLTEALTQIEAARSGKKGVAKTAEQVIKEIQENPILPIEPGENRTLRGYKIQFSSINGSYNVVDMDITTGMNQRQVNVNTINWLVVDSVKYTVK